MININECMDEAKACPAKSSCSNVLAIKSEPAVVFTNRTSFVGVKAIAEPVCDCINEIVGECLNGGLRVDGRCTCPDGFEGPNCEILSVGFNGNGWAMYRTFEACNNTDIQLNVRSESEDGLIFYVGPLTPKHALLSKGKNLVFLLQFAICMLSFQTTCHWNLGRVKSCSNWTWVTVPWNFLP